jgi:hypothetical protein
MIFDTFSSTNDIQSSKYVNDEVGNFSMNLIQFYYWSQSVLHDPIKLGWNVLI